MPYLIRRYLCKIKALIWLKLASMAISHVNKYASLESYLELGTGSESPLALADRSPAPPTP